MSNDENINSHIQMPKEVLKRFHNRYNSFRYYDVVKGIIGKNGRANSINTENGYYSKEVEQLFNKLIETPLGDFLNEIDKVDFDKESFVLSEEIKIVAKTFAWSLISRDPTMYSAFKKKSVFAQFVAGNLHDYAAISGMGFAEEKDMFSDYIVTFLINKTDTPFVLPICGLYSYSRNKHRMMNIPISSKIAICFANKSYSGNIIHDDGAVTFFEEYDYENIKIMNGAALLAQIKREWGYVVCTERNELDRLVAEYCSK